MRRMVALGAPKVFTKFPAWFESTLCPSLHSACRSCSAPAPHSAPTPGPDTLHIVASRLFESRTYEDFLEPLASPDVIHWHDASELTPAELSDVLGSAHGVLMTGGADIHPARYGQASDTARCGTIDIERDQIESALLHA